MRSILLVLAMSSIVIAQKQFQYFEGTEYDPKIPTPKSVLGYEIGERFTNEQAMQQYIDRVVQASDRVHSVVYGESYEHRPLQILIVSSPTNLSNLEQIRTSNLRLTDPRHFKSSQQAAGIIDSLPVIVWLAYGVHGNEASSTEAALLTLYQLCAGTDTKTRNLLDHAVVIIDPDVNPDGRERFVQWNNAITNLTPNENPEAREHNEDWPGGRGNHYYFDLNRDWSWLTQAETQARVKLYRSWMPHVYVDYHEMGYNSSYFFFPAQPPFHTEFPASVKKWEMIFGKGNAEAFDKQGIAYFAGEEFDLLYPGFGDTWPTFHGAIGMTYEQAGGGTGLAIRKRTGQVLTLHERARNHFITSIATIETASKNRREKIQDFYEFWGLGLKNTSRTTAFIIRSDERPHRAAELSSVLIRQGIEVRQLQQPETMEAREFYSKKPARETFPAGTYIVSLEQPESHFARALLEPQTTVTDTFFYDVSAWSLPVAYGLSAYTTESPIPSEAIEVENPPSPEGKVSGGRARYAYLIPTEQTSALKLVWRLLEKKYLLTVATRPFETGGRFFKAGTVVALTGNNSDSLHDDIASYARKLGVEVSAENTGLTEKGISLSSNRMKPIIKSNIAVLTDAPFFSSDYGELWYLFERKLEIPFTAINSRDLARANLSEFDVLILPDASDFRGVLDSASTDMVKRWVNQGGVLIGLDGSARLLTKTRTGLTAVSILAEKKEDEKTKEEKDRDKKLKEMTKRMTLFEKQENNRRQYIPGSVFRAIVDTTHPIGFGSPREVYVFKGNGAPIELSEVGHSVIRFAEDTTEVSGYASRDRAKKVAETAYVQDVSMGRGHVVLFAENVTFRMFWSGLYDYLINAFTFLPDPK